MRSAKLAVRETAAPAVALITSLSTLVCCTLPAVMITLGMGAALSSLTSNVPQLIWLSAHKLLVFGGSFVLLCLAWLVRFLTRNMPCPADPAQAKLCSRLRAIGYHDHIHLIAATLKRRLINTAGFYRCISWWSICTVPRAVIAVVIAKIDRLASEIAISLIQGFT